MSSIKQCGNGHYYDNDIFRECPYCLNGHGKVQNRVQPVGESPTGMRIVVENTGNFTEKSEAGKKQTVMFVSPDQQYSSEPVAGWLVCVKGNDKGKSFCVLTGKTSIGRAGINSYKVNLNDEKISRNSAAAVITYIEDTRSFFISLVQEGNVMIVVNEQYLSDSAVLHSNDNIRIGETELIFISFCNLNFDWSSYKVKYPPKI